MIEILVWVMAVLLPTCGYIGYARLSNRMSRLSSGVSDAAAIQPAKPVELLGAVRGHELKRIWYTNSTASYSTDGWWFECKCGTSGTSIERGHNKNQGSEEAAMNRWKKHVKIYKDMSIADPWEAKYRELQAKHDAHVEACICKNL